MMKKLLRGLVLPALFVVLSTSGWANILGPVPAVSGAPTEGTCTDCHNSFPLNSGTGRVGVTVVDGNTRYTPGVPKRLRVAVEESTARRWGYQLSARTRNGNNQAGTFRLLDGNSQVICSDSTQRPGNGACDPLLAPVEYASHTSLGTRNGTTGGVTFDVEWLPPTSDQGEVVFYAAGVAANGNGANAGDRVYTTSLAVQFEAASGGGPKPVVPVEGIVNAASSQRELPFSEGSFFSIYGQNFGTQTLLWDSAFVNNNAPTILGGVRVLVNGTPAPISLASPGQINAVAPAGVRPGGNSVVVEVNGVASDSVSVTAGDVSPALFTFSPQGDKYLAGTSGDGSAYIGPTNLFGGPVNGRPFRGARSGEVIILYGTGFGPTNPPTIVGRVPSGAAPTANPVQFRIGTAQVTPEYAGASGFVAVYQFNLRVPQLPNGEYEVVATVNGASTPVGKVLLVAN